MIARKGYKIKQKYLDKLQKGVIVIVTSQVTERRYILIKTDELRGIIAKNGLSQSDVAAKIGIAPKTFYEKMKNGVFGSNEIQIMINELHIEDPMSIFFAKE